LADQLSPDERARTQGFNDLLMGLVAASGSFLSGHVFAAVGYATMGAISAALSLAPLGLATWWLLKMRVQPYSHMAGGNRPASG
jgi:predicted MFS family arabinose efflux permease